jgi:predicted dehydrogenase
MIQVGIIGCGGVAATRHIPALLKVDNAKIRGFFDSHVDRVDEYTALYGGIGYKSLEEMLEDRQVDAVEVCTAAKSHCAITVAALEAGKHVLCEKPMAVSADDARAMIRAAEKSGKKLMVSHNQRLYAPHQKARELIRSGAIGKPLTFRSCLGIRGPEYASVHGVNNSYFNKEKSGRGVVSDVGAHSLDLIRYLMGSEYEQVFSYTPTLEKRYPNGELIDVDDNAFSIVKMKNGVVGSVIASWTSVSGNDRHTQIFGTEGVITTYLGGIPLKLEDRDGSAAHYFFEEETNQAVVLLTRIDQMFIDCIANDSEPFVTGRDGLAVILAVDAMEKSNQTGAWVQVQPLEV